MKLYAYCLVADLETTVTASGLCDAPVRMLKFDDIGMLVSDFEYATAPVTGENGLVHDTVVRSVFDQTTPLPFRFGTLGTEEQLRRFVTTNKVALSTKLAHVRGCVEMNLKIMWNYKAGALSQPPESDQPVAGPGTKFLKEKRRELLGDERRIAQVAELSNLLREPLGSLIKDEHTALRPSETVVFAAVEHLIERPGIEQYQTSVAEFLDKRPDLRIRMSGPWPPYSFANIELEFNARFGVS